MLCPYKPIFDRLLPITLMMMNPVDTVILKAFLRALANMSHPLSEELQKQLNRIDVIKEPDKLDDFAQLDAELQSAYEDACEQLYNKQAQRTKGPIIDDSEADRNDNVEIHNFTRVSIPLTEENLPKIAQEVAQSEDSVKAMQEIYDKIKYCLC